MERDKLPVFRIRKASAAWVAPTWEELVRDHSERVFRLALRLTGNRHDAEDLTQEVFIKVFRSIHKFEPGTIEGWLHRITTNLFIDSTRRRSRFKESAHSHVPDFVWGEADDPGRLRDDAELDHDVEAALAALTPECRVAVVLCDIEGLSYDEIAQVLDIKLSAVRSRIHRGRTQLRAALEHRRPTSGRERYLGVSG